VVVVLSGAGKTIAQENKSLGARQTAFDAEITAIESALFWFLHNRREHRALVIHSDSTSAIARVSHTRARPRQQHATCIQKWVHGLQNLRNRRTVDIKWVKGHSGIPDNERADKLAGKAAERLGPYTDMSLAHLKLKISERFRKAKEDWHTNPSHHGAIGIPPPPPEKSMMDKARNVVTRTAAQIRTGHWRSVVYLHRIRKRLDDKCWFCQDLVKMARSHVLLHCRNHRLKTARLEAWEGKNPGGVRALLANPRWERRFVRFLELSGVGRTTADGTDEESAYAARMDEWIAWEPRGARDAGATARQGNRSYFFSLFFLVWGYSCPRDLRTAHCGGRRISFVVTARLRPGRGLYLSLGVTACFTV